MNIKATMAGIIIAALIGISITLMAVYTIESGTVGVIATFGEYNEEEAQPGLHFKIPFVQTIQVFDVKMQTANYVGRTDAPDLPGIINKPYITVLDDKNLQIGTDLTIQFTPDPHRADEILKTFGRFYFDKKLNAIIRNVVRDIAGQYQAETIASRRTELGNEIKVRLQKEFEDLPFTLQEVALRNLALPKIVIEKIEQVQQAKQEEQRLAMVEKQAQQDQKIKRTQAETKLIQVTTQAKAHAEKLKIEADAKAYAILKEAEGRAKANELIARSLSPILVQFKQIDKWDGVMPRALLGEGNTSLLMGVEGLTKPASQ
ncbi:MAG: hypothetical protein GY934_01950 [Gammaproteobacteria bacterium]|nr:hypothetical protein [Gammaproteobacteria bacterium]